MGLLGRCNVCNAASRSVALRPQVALSLPLRLRRKSPHVLWREFIVSYLNESKSGLNQSLNAMIRIKIRVVCHRLFAVVGSCTHPALLECHAGGCRPVDAVAGFGHRPRVRGEGPIGRGARPVSPQFEFLLSWIHGGYSAWDRLSLFKFR